MGGVGSKIGAGINSFGNDLAGWVSDGEYGTSPSSGGGEYNPPQKKGGIWSGFNFGNDVANTVSAQLPGGSNHTQDAGPYAAPGLKPGETQTQFQGLDFTQYGPAEQRYRDNQSTWSTPGQGEQNAYGVVDKYSSSGTPNGSNNTQNWFDQYRAPEIAAEPGLEGYYDNAKQRAAESIDQAAAARGNYGSSSAIDQNSRAFADLEAQMAKDRANYNLARLGEQRGWQSLGGQLAGQADQNALARSQNEQQWQSFLSGLGLSADEMGLRRQNAGMDAAIAAQNAERNRGSDYFNNQLAMGDRMSGLIERSGNRALDNDMALLDQVLQGNISVEEATANMDQQAKAQFMNDLNSAGQIYGAYKSI